MYEYMASLEALASVLFTVTGLGPIGFTYKVFGSENLVLRGFGRGPVHHVRNFNINYKHLL